MTDEPALRPSRWAVGDPETGDAWIVPGVDLDLHAEVLNAGLAASGAEITGTLTFAPDGEAGGLLGQDTTTFHDGGALAAGEIGVTDTPFGFSVHDGAETGDVVELELTYTDEVSSSDAFRAVSLLVGGTRVGEDPLDHDGSFDLADLQVALVDGQWAVLLTSHGVHDGLQWVSVMVDLDGGGAPDYIVSTHNYLEDTFEGVVYDAQYVPIGTPACYRFEPGTNHTLMCLSIPVSEFPDVLYLQATSQDPFSLFSGRDCLPDHDAQAPWIRAQL